MHRGEIFGRDAGWKIDANLGQKWYFWAILVAVWLKRNMDKIFSINVTLWQTVYEDKRVTEEVMNKYLLGT